MDYCTHFPEGWWATCCQAHDAAYAAQIGRIEADLGLLSCVASSGGSGAMSLLAGAIGLTMFIGVRLFGSRYYRKS
jgi:hypothetical protein